ncbi:MAG: hypothetical protein IPP17_27295 [Bacteroidetes bacterium]|nr:hypothetical protein [Bacteroidota bacterium]
MTTFFAEVMTVYILIGIHFEERESLWADLGRYRRYQAEVPMDNSIFEMEKR